MATEAEIRAELGIPTSATTVLILSQSSHLDWDWLLPFPVLLDNQPQTTTTYFANTTTNGTAAQIFTAAGTFLGKNESPAYYYSICEIGFLRGYAEADPAGFASLKSAKTNLRIVGGGITSPDNLLPIGEAFIRNYLIGKLWVDANLQLPMNQAWLPDDFGQDSQLPVLLAAMGFQGVGFSRVPGASPYSLTPTDGHPSVAAQLLKSGVDFVWQANDGSTVLAHWMQDTYCQGDAIGTDPITEIAQFIATNQPASPTPYIFVPVGCDFRLPQDLPSFAHQWNTQSPAPSVYAVAATFDHYIHLISFHGSALQTLKAFDPVPYHTGCYPMRPLVKRLHHKTTRALLGAEVYAVIADAAGLTSASAASRVAAVDAVWNQLSPSTHHDYITGSALNPVYMGEQVPLIREARQAGRDLLDGTLAEVAAAVTVSPQSGEIPVVVFNPLGVGNSSLVKLDASTSMATLGLSASWSVRDSGNNQLYAQPTADGGLWFSASVGSLGYAVYYVSQTFANEPADPVTVKPAANDKKALTIANGLVSFTISPDANWAITEIYDLGSASPATNILTGNANDLLFYDEGQAGTNYNFANEASTNGMSRAALALYGEATAVVHEQGPLRARVVTTAVFTEPISKRLFTYTREYVLHWNEPFIRLRTVGAAPYAPGSNATGYCVAVQFPLASAIDGIAHGTTAHWSDLTQVRYWSWGPAFQATHDFVIASDAGGQALGAVYHGWVNAWGQTSSDDASAATLLGCILRNTTGTNFDYFSSPAPADGTDPGVHVLDYAFRVPSSLGSPAGGAPLAESLRFQAPMTAVVPPVTTSALLPETFSLASATSSDGTQVFITAAKLGSAKPDAVIVRMYQPSNNTTTPPTVTLSLAGLAQFTGASSFTVTPVTALEASIAGAESGTAATSYAFAATAALTTLAVT